MTRLIVVTGGPGAGKTALLEMARRHFCEHVAFLPESAGIVFGGGFPRRASDGARRAAQRAIYHVQAELERLTSDEGAVTALCDRGTLDGLAYWPDGAEDFWSGLATSAARELGRYEAVLLLRTPPPSEYNHKNPLRIESAREAAIIDDRICAVWRDHPRLHVVDHTQRFMTKMQRALDLLHGALGPCPVCGARQPQS